MALMETAYRPLSEYEASLLARLLEVDFEGRDAMARQVQSVVVREIDDSGSIEFKVGDEAPRANVTQRVPIEGEASDEDGVPIWVMLFVIDGKIDELEICKADGTPIRRRPLARELEVFTYPPPKDGPQSAM
ncbi:MAG: DUF6984 family protein [Thermoanaerobaculia bacterium]